jgi:hypothetical protein
MRTLIVLALILTACGSETGSKEPLRFASYKTEQDLPACNESNRDEIVHVKDGNNYLVCDQGGEWR